MFGKNWIFIIFFSLGRGDERWTKNKSYFRMDGCKNGLNREKLVNEFNSNSEVFLFLISTRTGNLGVNLIGANRVVVFDASWNHRHDQKAACRVYRLFITLFFLCSRYGQKKPKFYLLFGRRGGRRRRGSAAERLWVGICLYTFWQRYPLFK